MNNHHFRFLVIYVLQQLNEEQFVMRRERYGLLRWAGQLLKYFVLILFGFGVACILPILLGAPDLSHLLFSLFGCWLWRLAVLLFVFLATTVVIESVRS